VRVELHPDARLEFRSAALWYEEQRVGWSDEFVAKISAALDHIGERPESFPKWSGTRETSPPIRRATIQRFPYLIAFEAHEHHVLVLAVAHAKRRPLYWLSRATP
jgi:toxin ParE1/3/4